MLRALAVIALLLLAPFPARAEALSDADRAEFQRIIAAQIEAFRADDGERAYGYAAPSIKRMFPTPESFMQMVREGYPAVYRPQRFGFGPVGSDPPSQRVTIIGPDGRAYEAFYTFERQPDGTWRISSCTLFQMASLEA
jgi:hypothetical protein